jgi:hypothetical protein
MLSMMFGAKVPGYFWSEAINTTNYFINRGPTRANGEVTPEEQFSQEPPNKDNLGMEHIKQADIANQIELVRFNIP